jgi:hypothetical protein
MGQIGIRNSSICSVMPKLNGFLQMTVQIYAEPSVKDSVGGLCGAWDDDPSNDWQDETGKDLDLQDFVASWPVKAIKGIKGIQLCQCK